MGDSRTISFLNYLVRPFLCHQWLWLFEGMAAHNKKSWRPRRIPPCAKIRPSHQVLQIRSESRDDDIFSLCVSSALEQFQAGSWHLVVPYLWYFHLLIQSSLLY